MFEHKSEPLAPRSIFYRRLAKSGASGMAVIVLSLAVGMYCYHAIEGLSWIDAYLNSAMLLGGMGPLEHERNFAGKLFEGLYAIYCGLAVISVTGIVLAPAVHRFMHKHHLENPADVSAGGAAKRASSVGSRS